MDRLVLQHFSKLRDSLLAVSNRFDIPKHGDVKGYCREALVSDFLEAHCPSILEYSTGEIIDSQDNRSGQVDILITSKTAPRLPLMKSAQLAFSECVVASVEVKSNLTTSSDWSKSSHLKLVFNQTQKIKTLVRCGPEYQLRPIPVIAFCFSGPKLETLLNHIVSYSNDFKCGVHEFCPDVVSVLDQGYSISHNNGLISQIKGEFPLITWEAEVSMSIAIPYIYITRCSEMFMIENRFSNIAEYFKDFQL